MKTAPATIDAALATVAALTPAEQQRLIRRLKDRGILERRPRRERKAERNALIRADHGRGLTPGQIAGKLGMTRDAVRQVLRRGKLLGTLESVPIAE
jgi:hypothetical protein